MQEESKENTQNRRFLTKSEELQDSDWVDILLHPVDLKDWKSAGVKAVGCLFGIPTKWVHTSLRISMEPEQGQQRRGVLYDYTDRGVISYNKPRRKTTGIIRLVVEPTYEGVQYISRIIERIDDMHQNEYPLDWWQGIPIVKREEPSSMVCTTFVMRALNLPCLGKKYRTPQAIMEQFKYNKFAIKNSAPIKDVLFWEE